jgi:DNA-binding transcriptional ArsR family regulator
MDEIEELAEIFKALSDPTRLKLVRLLSQQPEGECTGPCNGTGFLCVNALAHKLGVTQSAVSQHLRILRQAGLVRGERRGPFVHYSLDQDGLDKYRIALQETLGEGFTPE